MAYFSYFQVNCFFTFFYNIIVFDDSINYFFFIDCREKIDVIISINKLIYLLLWKVKLLLLLKIWSWIWKVNSWTASNVFILKLEWDCMYLIIVFMFIVVLLKSVFISVNSNLQLKKSVTVELTCITNPKENIHYGFWKC